MTCIQIYNNSPTNKPNQTTTLSRNSMARFLRMSSTPLGLNRYRPASSNSAFSNSGSKSASSLVIGRDKYWGNYGGQRKSWKETCKTATRVLTNSECVITEPKADKGPVAPLLLLLLLLLANVREVMFRRLNHVLLHLTKTRPWKLYVQSFIEKVIIDCRFFTLFAVAGSLLGSALCFVEGCFLILESYFEYFHALSQGSEQGHLVQLLIEAIDMFIVATAMLVFGMGLHVLFVGSSHLQAKGSHLSQSNYLKILPPRAGMHSIMQAKSKIGHAVIMLLQAGVLEKFKSIPLATAFDLACFAGAVFVSSACIFVLSKLATFGGSGTLPTTR